MANFASPINVLNRNNRDKLHRNDVFALSFIAFVHHVVLDI